MIKTKILNIQCKWKEFLLIKTVINHNIKYFQGTATLEMVENFQNLKQKTGKFIKKLSSIL